MKDWVLADVAKHWDETLEYDEINSKTDSYFRRFTDSAPLFVLPDNSKVLDIDCRTGNGSAFFAQKYKTCHFTGLAVSPLFQSLAQKTFDAEKVCGETGVFESLPLAFDNSYFDAILCYETIEHMPCPEDFVAELARLTKPGGLLVLTTPNILWEPIHLLAPILGLHHSEGPHRMLSRRRLRRILKKIGFSLKKRRPSCLCQQDRNFYCQLVNPLKESFPNGCWQSLPYDKLLSVEKI